MIRHFRRLFAIVLMLMLMVPAAQAKTQAMNILLIGVDAAREGRNGRSDAMILVRADPADGSMRMVSFLRDLYVRIPGVGKTRLNAAYFYGGEELLKQTLSENFGVEVDRTVTVHFSMLADLVDQLGGIELEITEKERMQLNDILADSLTGAELEQNRLEEAGVHHLNGAQALCYSRIRKIDSDFQRTSRQQAVIAAMLRQASALGHWEMLKLALTNLPRVQTDMTIGDIAALLPLVTKLGSMELSAAHVPFDGAYTDETINGMMVLSPNLERNKTKLSAFLNGD